MEESYWSKIVTIHTIHTTIGKGWDREMINLFMIFYSYPENSLQSFATCNSIHSFYQLTTIATTITKILGFKSWKIMAKPEEKSRQCSLWDIYEMLFLSSSFKNTRTFLVLKTPWFFLRSPKIFLTRHFVKRSTCLQQIFDF